MATDTERLNTTLLTVEADLEALGWDKPARLFALEGNPADPHLVLITEVGGHPYDFLTRLSPMPNRALGLVLVCETWVYKAPEELVKGATAALEQQGVPQELHGRFINRFIKEVVLGGRPISESPNAVESRMAFCALRGGYAVAINRARGEEPEIMSEQDDVQFDGRIVDELRRLL